MSRDEAINYLQYSESFYYDYLYISAGDWILDIKPDSDAFDCMLQEIVVALKQEDDLIERAIEDSERTIEARKEADKEKKYSHDKIYRQLLDCVRAELKKLGWEGDFRVFTSGNYNTLWCLSLRISPVSECYFSGTPEDVLANVRDLYNFAMIQLSSKPIPSLLLGKTDISRMKNGSIEAMESLPQILY